MLKKIFNELKNNSFKRIMIELSLLVVLFNINLYIGIALLSIVLFEIIICKDYKNLLYIFLFLSFNDEILKLDILRGSISRIVMILIILKIAIKILKERIKPTSSEICVIIFFAISTIIGIIKMDSIVSSLISLLNIVVIVLFSIILKEKKKENIEQFIEKICYVIVISVLCGTFYGLLAGNFLGYMQGSEMVYRFNGSYEPNFMCMYINLAILSLITIKNKINKILYFVLVAFFININILTASMTGLLSLFVSLVAYFFMFIKERKIIIKNTLIIAIIGILIFGVFKVLKPSYNKNFIEGEHRIINKVESEQDELESREKLEDVDVEDDAIAYRFKRINKLLEDGKIDEMTSGRTALIRTFIKASFKRPLINILFGNGITDKKIYTKFFGRKCLAHNSYADFLYNFGIVGFLLVIKYIFSKTIKNTFLSTNIINTMYCKNIKVIRILLLIYAFTLSFYTKRMFLIFFLI